MLQLAIDKAQIDLMLKLKESNELLNNLTNCASIIKPEVQRELDNTLRLRQQLVSPQKKNKYVTLSTKIEFITEKLKNSPNGEIAKSELLRSASCKFQRSVNPNFLDVAIKTSFETHKKNNSKIALVVTAKGLKNKKNLVQ